MATQLLDGTVADRPRPAPARKPRLVWSSNPVVVLWGTMVGKKVVMAVTGLVLVGFVIGHMLGNLKIFLGAEAIDDEFTKMTAILDLRSSVFGSVRE